MFNVIQVALHFWGTGGGALPVVSFLFLRDLCIRLGSDCLDECFKGIYKAYVLNCQFINYNISSFLEIVSLNFWEWIFRLHINMPLFLFGNCQ